eukprot:394080_1
MSAFFWSFLIYICTAELPQSQIDALIDFYYALDGPNWHSRDSNYINCTWNITHLQLTHQFCHPITPLVSYQVPFCGLLPVAVKWVGRHNNPRIPFIPIENATWCQTLTGIDFGNIGLNGTIP